MAFMYPDNLNRAARVKDLTNNISIIQTAIKESRDMMQNKDSRSLQRLTIYAKNRGFATIDDYVDSAMNMMSAQDRDIYMQIQKQRLNGCTALVGIERINRSILVIADSVGITALGKCMMQTYFLGAYKQLAEGISMIVEGATQAGVKLVSAATQMIQAVCGTAEVEIKVAGTETAAGTIQASIAVLRAVSTASEGSAEVAAKGLSLIKMGSLATLAISALVEISIITYEAVERGKQKDELQGDINNLVCRRWATKATQLLVNAALACTDDLCTIINLEITLQELVANGTIPAEVKNKTIREKFDEFGVQFNTEHNRVTESIVTESLKQMDINAQSWTDEDPGIEGIRDWLLRNFVFNPSKLQLGNSESSRPPILLTN